MQTAKDDLIRLLQAQPDDSTYEELVNELAFAAMVRRGLRDSDEGRTVSDDEMRRRIQSW